MARQPLIDASRNRKDSRAKRIEDALSEAMTPSYAPSKSLRPKARPANATMLKPPMKKKKK